MRLHILATSTTTLSLLTLTTATLQLLPKDWEVNICDINIKNIQGRDKENVL